MNNALRQVMEQRRMRASDLAALVGVNHKTVQRWLHGGRVPHHRTALEVADALGVALETLWPDTDEGPVPVHSEVVALYPHRAAVPKPLWSDLIRSATTQIGLLAYASQFLPEENPGAIALLRQKARSGVRVRLVLADPDSPEAALRGAEERLGEALAARIRMALAHYRPLIGAPGVEFHQHRTTLYNSIFRFDDEMLVNQHVYGTYGYLAPILHLRRDPAHDMFDMYATSFERVWETSYPLDSAS
ncbi:helix-turn-helix domain-containing protein [Myceligenerans salitolerans]|uniref:Helix-turn-helix domain-containing protein n=1 Tax=Myceligenerans salitolerans TaxID=1230528 RepID=A0ABS3IE50_9MICO|nr:helix-turn-helix transcriptional regulator [Myceligenerans salitolerans]MBO0610693.1 helix-turn-helix domain-containing protein [Myceligenerans salitolerans]